MIIAVAIIGAGPAGTATAIQLKRSGCDFLLLEKNAVGGLLREANLVENFPGIPKGLPGRLLAARLQRQLAAAGIIAEKTAVRRLGYHDGRFTIHSEKRTLTAAKVVLACGTLPLPFAPPLDLPQLQGRTFTSVLPLLKKEKQTIAVIGGGDAACDYALNLARKNRVHLVIRSGRPRALPLLLDRCRRHPNITIHENSPVLAAAAATDGVILKTREKEIVCQHVLTAIGREPALHFLEPDLRTFLAELQRQKKIYIVGDAGNGIFRQAAIAAADGLHAAMEIAGGPTE